MSSPPQLPIDDVRAARRHASRLLILLLVTVLTAAVAAPVDLGAVDLLVGHMDAGTNFGATGGAARLSSPRGIAFDSNGTLFIAEFIESRVSRVDNATGIHSLAIPTLSDVVGVLVDPYDDNVVLVSLGSNPGEIRAIALDNSVSPTTVVSGVNQPAGFDFRLDTDTLYYAVFGADEVGQVLATGGSHAIVTISVTSAPFDVTIKQGSDHLFACAQGSHKIFQITFDGTSRDVVAGSSAGATDGTGTSAQFNSPSFGAITSDGSYLFVTDNLGNRVRRMHTTTYVVDTTVNVAGTTPSSGQPYPATVADSTLAEIASPLGIAFSRSFDVLAIAGINAVLTIQFTCDSSYTFLPSPTSCATDSDQDASGLPCSNLYDGSPSTADVNTSFAAGGSTEWGHDQAMGPDANVTYLYGSAQAINTVCFQQRANSWDQATEIEVYAGADTDAPSIGIFYPAEGETSLECYTLTSAEELTAVTTRIRANDALNAGDQYWAGASTLTFAMDTCGPQLPPVTPVPTPAPPVPYVEDRTIGSGLDELREVAYSDYDGGRVYILTPGYLWYFSIETYVAHQFTFGGVGSGGSSRSTIAFNDPYGMAYHCASRRIFISDSNNYQLRFVQEDTDVAGLFAGLTSTGLAVDGASTGAKFVYTMKMVVYNHDMYVIDGGGICLRKVAITTAYVSTFAGNCASTANPVAGPLTNRKFQGIGGLTVADEGASVIVFDQVVRELWRLNGGWMTRVMSMPGSSSQLPTSIWANPVSNRLYIAWAVDLSEVLLWSTDNETEHEFAEVTTGFAYAPSLTATPNGTFFAGYTFAGNKFRELRNLGTDEWTPYCEQPALQPSSREHYEVQRVAGLSIPGTFTLGDTCTTSVIEKPSGIAVFGTNVYVADNLNQVIVSIDTASSTVSLFAGVTGSAGFTDNTLRLSAKFAYPAGMSMANLAGQDTLVVAEELGHRIRNVDITNDNVGTLAGSSGGLSGTGSSEFNTPKGVECGNDYCFIADTNNHVIKRWDGGNHYIAGSASAQSGFNDDIGTSARFNRPFDITETPTALYVADFNNFRVRRIDPSTIAVSTVIGDGSCGNAAGTMTLGSPSSRICTPLGITSFSEFLYITDYSLGTVLEGDITGNSASVIAGLSDYHGRVSATGTAARFYTPQYAAIDGSTMYVADSSGIIKSVNTGTKEVTEFCFDSPYGSTTGGRDSARFAYPVDFTFDTKSDVMYIADKENYVLKSIDMTGHFGLVSDAAGAESGHSSCSGDVCEPTATAFVDSDVNRVVVFVQRAEQRSIKAFNPRTNAFSNYAGQENNGGFQDSSTGIFARFSKIGSLATDGYGNLYAADWDNKRIRRIEPMGSRRVSTVAGTGSDGMLDGNGGSSMVGLTTFLATDSGGNVIFTDDGSTGEGVRKLMLPGRSVTTIKAQGPSSLVMGAIAVDAYDVYYFFFGNEIYRIPEGTNFWLFFAGSTTTGYQEGTLESARFSNGVSPDLRYARLNFYRDDLYMLDSQNRRVRVIRRVTHTETLTITLPLTPSRTYSLTRTVTDSQSPVPTPTRTFTDTVPPTTTATTSYTLSETSRSTSASFTPSRNTPSKLITKTTPLTTSVSLSLSATTSGNISQTVSSTASPNVTSTVSSTLTESGNTTQTLSPTRSATESLQKTASNDITQTKGTPTSSHTFSANATVTPSLTTTPSGNITSTESHTATLTTSGSLSVSATLPPTVSPFGTVSKSLTVSLSSSVRTPTASANVTSTVSLTDTRTKVQSPSVTHIPTVSRSLTRSASPTDTVTGTESESFGSPSATDSAAVTVSPSESRSQVITISDSTTPSSTDSAPSESLTHAVTETGSRTDETKSPSQSAEVSTTPSDPITDTSTVSPSESQTETRNPFAGLRIRLLPYNATPDVAYTARGELMVLQLAGGTLPTPLTFQPYREDGEDFRVQGGLTAAVRFAGAVTDDLSGVLCSGFNIPCNVTPTTALPTTVASGAFAANVSTLPAPTTTRFNLRVFPGIPASLEIRLAPPTSSSTDDGEGYVFFPGQPLATVTRSRVVTVRVVDGTASRNVVDWAVGDVQLRSKLCNVTGGAWQPLVRGVASFSTVILTPIDATVAGFDVYKCSLTAEMRTSPANATIMTVPPVDSLQSTSPDGVVRNLTTNVTLHRVSGANATASGRQFTNTFQASPASIPAHTSFPVLAFSLTGGQLVEALHKLSSASSSSSSSNAGGGTTATTSVTRSHSVVHHPNGTTTAAPAVTPAPTPAAPNATTAPPVVTTLTPPAPTSTSVGVIISNALTCSLAEVGLVGQVHMNSRAHLTCMFYNVPHLAAHAGLTLAVNYTLAGSQGHVASAPIPVVSSAVNSLELHVPAASRLFEVTPGATAGPVANLTLTMRDLAGNAIEAPGNTSVTFELRKGALATGTVLWSQQFAAGTVFAGGVVTIPSITLTSSDTGRIRLFAKLDMQHVAATAENTVEVHHTERCEDPAILSVSGCESGTLVTATYGCTVDAAGAPDVLTITGIRFGHKRPQLVTVAGVPCRSFRFDNVTSWPTVTIRAFDCRGQQGLNESVGVQLADGRNVENVTRATVSYAQPTTPDVVSLRGCQPAYPSIYWCPVEAASITVAGRNLAAAAKLRLYLLRGAVYECTGPVTFVAAADTAAPPNGFDRHDEVTFDGCDGFGDVLRYDVLDATGAPITGRSLPDRPAIRFAPSRFDECPYDNSSDALCGHGTCDAVGGTCVCDASPSNGFWTGPACNQCVHGYALSECKAECPRDGENRTCSGAGLCNATTAQCECVESRVGVRCEAECPGTASAVCFGHGACYDATPATTAPGDAVPTPVAACTCLSDPILGSWSPATGCATCAAGYVGPNCSAACPTDSSDAVCAGRGTCTFNGTVAECLCHEPGVCGLACETSGAECFTCPTPFAFGPDCDDCPGLLPERTDACSGHGVCFTGKAGSGECLCDPGYTLLDCSVPCPGGATTPCTGHGTCSAGNYTCTCLEGFAGFSCAITCPGLVTPCSGHGTCADGATGDGTCTCAPGFMEPDCLVECPRDAYGQTCSNRGECTPQGCACWANETHGFFGGADCSVCATNYHGAQCTTTCGFGFNSTAPCGGHGLCTPELTCLCERNLQSGYWNGTQCDRCSDGYWGPSCLEECPGTACAACSFNGRCFDGVNGNGTCLCDTVNGSSFGNADCSDCSALSFGAKCDGRCPQNNNGICGGHGACSSGVRGDGSCRCTTGFAPSPVDGTCSLCASGYFGPGCEPCQPSAAYACSLVGTCDDGISGTGACSCNYGRVGDFCEYSCPIESGLVCGGHGSCSQGVCTCEGYWTTDSSTGACTRCVAGVFGTDCASNCTITGQGAFCSGHGSCVDGTGGDGSCACTHGWYGPLCSAECPGGGGNACSGHGRCSSATGTCTCSANETTGFYDGFRCSRCDPRYESAACDIACPLFDGRVCNGRGTCFAGACTDCAPSLDLGDDIELVVCGASCQNTAGCPAGSACPNVSTWGATCDGVCLGITGDGVPCSGHGVCRRSNGQCRCSTGYVGPACEVNCPIVNGQVCSGNGECDAVNGTGCICIPGYAGADCSIPCPRGIGNLICSGQGSCDALSGSCVCDAGFARADCSGICNGGLLNPCSGNGVCDVLTGTCDCTRNASIGYFDGEDCSTCYGNYAGQSCNIVCSDTGRSAGTYCVCDEGYAGETCDLPCPGVLQGSICGGHGACNSGHLGDATCSCDTDYYTGNCSTFCSIDMCRNTYGMQYPQCNVNGTCECQDDMEGHFDGVACDTCQLFYWGSTCALQCICNENGGCNRNTGECECFREPQRGYWAGETCNECAAGYIGVDCRGINVQVSENVDSAASYVVRFGNPKAAFSVVDPTRGVMLIANTFIVVFNVSSALAKPEFVSQLSLVEIEGVGLRASDVADDEVRGEVTSIRISDTEGYIANVVWQNKTSTFFTFAFDSYDPLHIVSHQVGPVVSSETTLEAQERGGTTAPATTTTDAPTASPPNASVASIASAVAQGAAPSGRRLLAIDPANNPVKLVSDPTDGSVYRALRNGVVTIRRAGATTIDPVSDVAYSPVTAVTTISVHQQRLVVLGSVSDPTHGTPLWAIASARLPMANASAVTWELHTQATTPLSACSSTVTQERSCTSVERCASFGSSPTQLVCLMVADTRHIVAGRFDISIDGVTQSTLTGQAVQDTGALQLLRQRQQTDSSSSLVVTFTESVVLTTLRSSAIDVTHMEVDDAIGLVIAAFNEDGTPSSIVKIEISTLMMTGIHTLGYQAVDPELVQNMFIRSVTRELIAQIQLPFRITLRSFNLFGVRSVTPSIIDGRGGASITVYGEGFSAFAPPRCDFGGNDQTVEAQVVSTTEVRCTAPGSTSDDACTSIDFNVLFGNRTTSTSNVPLLRPTSVTLNRVDAQLGGAFGPDNNSTRITMYGVGFVPSVFAACQLVDFTGRRVFRSNLSVEYVNSTVAVCTQPAGLRSTVPPAYLSYAHDGQVFSTSQLPYAVVGGASGLRLLQNEVQAIADVRTPIPATTVAIVDVNGNVLSYYDDAPYGLGPWLVTAAVVNDEALGFVGGNLANGTLTISSTQRGEAVFDGLALDRPATGTVRIQFQTLIIGSVATVTLRVHVRVGRLSHIALLNPTAPRSWIIGTQGKKSLDPAPILVIADPANNPIRDPSAGLPLFMTLGYNYDAPNLLTGELEYGVREVNVTLNLDGTYPFSDVATHGLFGRTYMFNFRSPLETIAPLQILSTPLEKCQPGTEYGEDGSARCLPCPTFGICDGSTSVRVEYGAWRAAQDAFQFYSCDPPYSSGRACGNGTCLEGYSGPRCSVCADGFGKSGLECQKCADTVTNWVVISLVAIGVALVVFVLVISSLRDDPLAVTDADIMPIVVKMFVNHLQVSSRAGQSVTKLPSTLDAFFTVQQQGSSLGSPNLVFIQCELQGNFYRQFLAVCAIPIVLTIVFATAMAVRTLLARLRRIHEESLKREFDAPAEQNRDHRAQLAGHDDDPFDLVAEFGMDEHEAAAKHKARRKQQRRAVSRLGSRKSRSAGGNSSATPQQQGGGGGGGRPGTGESSSALYRDGTMTASADGSNVLEGTIGSEGFRGDSRGGSRVDAAPMAEEDFDYDDDESDDDEADEDELAVKNRMTPFQVIVVTSVIVLFLLYPTILEQCTYLLQCEDLDFGEAQGTRSVLIADRSIDCSSPTYRRYALVASITVVAFGVGVPIISVLAVNFIAAATCDGNHEFARGLFFFMTGGLTNTRWWWESIVMVRKAGVMAIVVFIENTTMRALGVLWFIGLMLIATASADPYADKRLSALEAISLLCIYVTTNLGLLFSASSVAGSSVAVAIIEWLLFLVNLLTVLAFIAMLFVGVRDKLIRTYMNDPERWWFLAVLVGKAADEREAERTASLHAFEALLEEKEQWTEVSKTILKGVHHDVRQAAELLRDYYVSADPVADSVYQSFARFNTFLHGKISVGEFDKEDIMALRLQEVTVLLTLLDCIRRDKAFIAQRRRGEQLAKAEEEERRKATERILEIKAKRDRFVAAFRNVADAEEFREREAQNLREVRAARRGGSAPRPASNDGAATDADHGDSAASAMGPANKAAAASHSRQQTPQSAAPAAASAAGDNSTAALPVPPLPAGPAAAADSSPHPSARSAHSAGSVSIVDDDEAVASPHHASKDDVDDDQTHPAAAPQQQKRYARQDPEAFFGGPRDPEEERKRKLELLWGARHR